MVWPAFLKIKYTPLTSVYLMLWVMARLARLSGVRVYSAHPTPNEVRVSAPAVVTCAANRDLEWEPKEQTTLIPPASTQMRMQPEEGTLLCIGAGVPSGLTESDGARREDCIRSEIMSHSIHLMHETPRR